MKILLKKILLDFINFKRQIGLFSTQRAYILKGDLAHLEDALVKYTLNYLQNKLKNKSLLCNISCKIFIICK
jgi:seryl-tRNA synthetase